MASSLPGLICVEVCPKAVHLQFLVLINDFILDCLVHQFIDDTMLTETLLTRPHSRIMQTYFEQLEAWTANNLMSLITM